MLVISSQLHKMVLFYSHEVGLQKSGFRLLSTQQPPDRSFCCAEILVHVAEVLPRPRSMHFQNRQNLLNLILVARLLRLRALPDLSLERVEYTRDKHALLLPVGGIIGKLLHNFKTTGSPGKFSENISMYND